jgi:hypothetical protein
MGKIQDVSVTTADAGLKTYRISCGKENQLDATQWLIELVICCTCFGHLYAHHQELETILLVTTRGV